MNRLLPRCWLLCSAAAAFMVGVCSGQQHHQLYQHHPPPTYLQSNQQIGNSLYNADLHSYQTFNDFQPKLSPYQSSGSISQPRLVPVVAERRSADPGKRNPKILPQSISVPSIFNQLINLKNKRNNKNVSKKAGKLIPEPGWFPVTPAVGQGVTASPILAIKTSGRQDNSFIGVPSVPSPVRTLQQQTGARYPGGGVQTSLLTVTTTPKTFVPENPLLPLTLNSRGDSIKVFPNDTVVIRYNTAALASLNTDPITNSVTTSSHAYVRNQRQADKSAPFLERIESIKGCAGDAVEDLILEILESPLRKRNALIGMLRLREKEREKQNEVPRSSNNNGGNRFSNFPQAAVANNAVSQPQAPFNNLQARPVQEVTTRAPRPKEAPAHHPSQPTFHTRSTHHHCQRTILKLPRVQK